MWMVEASARGHMLGLLFYRNMGYQECEKGLLIHVGIQFLG